MLYVTRTALKYWSLKEQPMVSLSATVILSFVKFCRV